MDLAEAWGGVIVGIEESLCCAEDFLLHTWVCCTLPESAVLGATVKIMLTPIWGNMAKYDPNAGWQKLRGARGPPPKILDSDENFKPEHTLFCGELRFVAIYALFFGDLWAKKCLFG